jgi:hypothetical protein
MIKERSFQKINIIKITAKKVNLEKNLTTNQMLKKNILIIIKSQLVINL